MMGEPQFFKKSATLLWVLLALGTLALVGYLDYITGPEIASSFFYLIPVAVAVWHTGKAFGIAISALIAEGGVAAIEQKNIAKAKLLYDYIDSTEFYANHVAVNNRSRMNIPFFLADERLNDAFLKGAEAQGLLQLKGHRNVGGMRASIYNAMPMSGVEALVSYMQQFESTHS